MVNIYKRAGVLLLIWTCFVIVCHPLLKQVELYLAKNLIIYFLKKDMYIEPSETLIKYIKSANDFRELDNNLYMYWQSRLHKYDVLRTYSSLYSQTDEYRAVIGYGLTKGGRIDPGSKSMENCAFLTGKYEPSLYYTSRFFSSYCFVDNKAYISSGYINGRTVSIISKALALADTVFIDFRDNTGGILSSAIDIVSLVTGYKFIVIPIYRRGKIDTVPFVSQVNPLPPTELQHKKIIFIVNRETYSAAELIPFKSKELNNNIEIICQDRTAGKRTILYIRTIFLLFQQITVVYPYGYLLYENTCGAYNNDLQIK